MADTKSKKHTVRCTPADEKAVDRLALLFAKELGVSVDRQETYVRAVRQTLAVYLGDALPVPPAMLRRVLKLQEFFTDTMPGITQAQTLDRALQIACQSVGLEQRTDVEPIGGE